MQLLHIAVALLLAIGVFVAVRVVRLLYLSPLARIPGPKLYAFTDWFYLYYLLRGEWPAKLKTLHDKYGPTLRYSPDDISSIEPETWKTVYGHKTHSDRNFEKDPLFLSPPPNGANSVLRADNDDHRRMRRVLAHAFSEKALRGQEDIINTYIDLFISRLAEKVAAKESIDIMRWFNLTTFDLIGDLAFGKPFGCLESGTYNPWVNMLFDTARFGTIGQAFRRYPLLGSLKSWLVPAKLGRSFAEHVQLSERTAMERIERGNVGRDDFMDYILRHNDEKGLSKAEIVSNASLLIIAGSETTATLLSGTTFHLLTNRDKYNKLVGEIRERFSSENEINMSSVNDLPYLLAVLQEGFRMYPPVPIGLARVAPSGGETVNGFYLPENTKISVAQWSAYQSEHNWTDPIRFVPERWLDVDTRYENDKRDVLQPFSVGPRNCIGKNLAYAEMRVILTRLLWRFDLEILPESHNWMDQRIFFLWDKPALMVKIMPAHKL